MPKTWLGFFCCCCLHSLCFSPPHHLVSVSKSPVGNFRSVSPLPLGTELPASSLFPTGLASRGNLSAHSPPAWSIFPCKCSASRKKKGKSAGLRFATHACHSREILTDKHRYRSRFRQRCATLNWTELTSPLEATLRFFGISNTRSVPCSSVTAKKCCLAVQK